MCLYFSKVCDSLFTSNPLFLIFSSSSVVLKVIIPVNENPVSIYNLFVKSSINIDIFMVVDCKNLTVQEHLVASRGSMD